MNRSALYICYGSVYDPLIETQVISYLERLAGSDIRIHLLTFERRRLPGDDGIEVRRRLAARGIRWHSLRYHARPSLPATLYDIGIGIVVSIHLCLRFNIRLVHARSHVSGAIAFALRSIPRVKVLFDLRGLLADEYADAGHWVRGGLKYRLTKAIERQLLKRADRVVMLTDRIKSELLRTGELSAERADRVTVIPCCVDSAAYTSVVGRRDAYRSRRGWSDRVVLTYVGKLGAWYLAREMARFFSVARREDSRYFLQILTQSDPGEISNALEELGVSAQDYDIRYATPAELPEILISSDAGISFIQPCYSKLASSPTKVGEYLAAGLPVIANAGIGDCDRLIAENDVGLIVESFMDDEYLRCAQALQRMVDDSGVTERCREAANRELSLGRVGGRRYVSLYETLFDKAAPGKKARFQEDGSGIQTMGELRDS